LPGLRCSRRLVLTLDTIEMFDEEFKVQSVERNNGLIKIHCTAIINGQPAHVYINIPCPYDGLINVDEIWKLSGTRVR